ncbi:hypothetical protein ACP70R_011937 [Stipagrostis hirtigluma subsp. patula]
MAEPMGHEVMSAIMNLFNEQDADRQRSGRFGSDRTRFFLVPYFARHCVHLSPATAPHIFRACFTRPYIAFNPARCNMILCPVQQAERWQCYAFMMKEARLVIIDPVMSVDRFKDALNNED